MTIEVEVRDYLRTRSSVMLLLNGEVARCNIEWTGNPKATHITLYRAGGGADGYVPHEYPIVTVHCFGSTRASAAQLADAVAAALRSISQANEPLRSCSVESINFVPAADGTARYVVTTVVTARLAAA